MDGAHPLLWTCGLQVQIPAHPMFQVPVSIRRSDRTDPSIAQTRSKPLCGRDLGRSQEDQCLAHRTRQGGNPGNAAKLRCVVAVVVVVAACCCVCVFRFGGYQRQAAWVAPEKGHDVLFFSNPFEPDYA